MFVFQQKLRRAHIRRQHTLFNQFVRIVAHNRNDFLNFAIAVENHLRLNAFKFNCTSAGTFFLQNFKQAVKRVDLFFIRMF